MRSFELKPSHDNLLNTLVNDSIGRNKDVFLFADIINSISDACSIALDGSWGSGKTFFVKQTKMLLEAHNPFVNVLNDDDRAIIISACTFRKDVDFEPQVCVYYDAWENDNDNEPILSLIYSIVSSINADYAFSNNTTFLQQAAAVLEFFTGKNWEAVVNSFKGESPFEEIIKARGIQSEIKEFLDSLLSERGNRLVVFIDELDRCKPSFAVKLLERIKHYFDNDRITFVFSINTLELQHTIKKHYGERFDACKYLDRFFDLRISIPKPNMTKFYQNVELLSDSYTYDRICADVIERYNFSLREIAKFVRLTKLAAYEPTHHSETFSFHFADGRALQFCLLYIVPLLIGLKVYNRDVYERFVGGEDSSPLINLLAQKDVYWFEHLWAFDETPGKDEAGKLFVPFEKKLAAVYDALFVTKFDACSSCVNIGQYAFSQATRDELFNVVNLLSKYTTIGEDS